MTFRVRNLLTGGSSISNPPNSDTNSAFLALRDSLRLRGAASLALLRELDSLMRENDPELQAEGFLALAGRQEVEGRVDIAGEIYATIVGAVRERPLQRRAQERLAVLQGGGPLGARIEHLSRHFAQQAADPALLAGMAVGSAVFQTFRLATFSRLAAAPTTSLFTRGLGARALSWGTGFAFEVPAFTFAIRGVNAALGREQDWSRQAIGRELMSAGLTLFLLKGSGAGASALTRRLTAEGGTARTLTRFTSAALPQAATFTGILAAHALEVSLGLRPNHGAENAAVESLATLLQFYVSGRLLRSATGNAYEARLATISRQLEGPTNPRYLPISDILQTRLAPINSAPSPARELLILMSTGPNDRKTGGTGPKIASSEPRAETPPPVPIKIQPELFQALRSQFSRLEFDMNYLFNEQSGQPMWAEQGHRITLELLDHLQLFDRHLPNPSDRPTLDNIRSELRWVRQMLADLRQAEDLVPASSPEVREFIGALYRIPNKAVNYVNSGALHDLEGSLFNARHARLALFDKLYRYYRVNADAEPPLMEDTGPHPSRLHLDPDHPSRPLQTPQYDYRDSFESPYLEIPGERRKVVLIGEIPKERVVLSRHHHLEAVVSNQNQFAKLAATAAREGNLNHLQIVWSDWRTRNQGAEYLEGYDIASADALVGAEGRELLREQVFSRLRPGGVALLISRDASALQRMVQIATENQWADVILGSYRGHLPVEVSRPDQESGNFVFLRKLPQF